MQHVPYRPISGPNCKDLCKNINSSLSIITYKCAHSTAAIQCEKLGACNIRGNANTCIQESHAIAKVTARCAVYMDALDNFESPWLRPPMAKLLMGFSCDGLYESAYKI